MVLVAIGVVVIGGLIAAGLALRDDDDASASVTLEPFMNVGADPFMATAAVRPEGVNLDRVGDVGIRTRGQLDVDPETHTLIATSSTPGLYGGTGNDRVCDGSAIVAFLARSPAKARAWAEVLGIAPSAIASYVAGLAPVLLTSDTLVTNHGYRDGRATTLQSVLQAGTAVMVDARGVPRVKCNCGNPLTPPDAIAPTHATGTAWGRYDPTQVVVVTPTRTMRTLRLVDVVTGAPYSQPVGDGKGAPTASGAFVAATSATPVGLVEYSTSSDGTTWTSAGSADQQVRAIGWADGKWLAVAAAGVPNRTSVFESTDLRTWTPVGTVPAYVADLAWGGDQWVAVGAEDDGDIGQGVVFSSPDGRTWTKAATDLGIELDGVAYGDGVWIAVDNGHQGGLPSRTWRSADGHTWTRQPDTGLDRQAVSHLAFGDGRWVLAGKVVERGQEAPDGLISVSSDAQTWTEVRTTSFTADPITAAAYGNGRWLVVTQGGNVFSSADATTWTKQSTLPGGASDLAFGGTTAPAAPPATTATAPPPTTSNTTAPVAVVAGIDWQNYTYQAQGCGDSGPATMTNGLWLDPATANTPFQCRMTVTAVDRADVTGDGVDDAIVNLHTSASGVRLGESDWTVVFTATGDGVVDHGYLYGQTFRPYDGGFTVWLPHPTAGDFGCCPSQYEKDAYRYSSPSGTFTKVDVAYVPTAQLPKRSP
jgi:hypothetical protein